ncbi:MAG: hypothetical protein ACJ78Q_00560, partial [Chloroflexia bacterium]
MTTTRREAGSRWWLVPGILGLLALALGLGSLGSPAKQAQAGFNVVLDTATSTATRTVTSTPSPTRTHTNTVTPTPTRTPTFTPTITPGGPPTNTPTDTLTPTPTPTNTPTTPTSTPGGPTSTPTITPGGPPTFTPTPTPTSTPTITPGGPPTDTPTPTPTSTPTITPGGPPTDAPTITPTRTPTPTWTPTYTVTPTSTPACGLAWNVINTVNVGAGNNSLGAVAVVASDDVWAAGSFFSSTVGADRTLVEHWNGSNWSQVASPNVGASGNTLSSLAVVSAGDIWAVGYYLSGGTQRTFTLHWDGTTWSVVSSPSVGAGDNFFVDVAAVSTSDVWAVGYYCSTNCQAGSQELTLLEHWNGNAWSVVSSPNPDVGNYVYSVSAVSTNDIWAVGYHNACYGCVGYSLVLHWNGTSWSVVPSPNAGVSTNYLTGISALSASN